MTTLASASRSTTAVAAMVEVRGLNVAYREAGDPASPNLVLLQGFPASSH